MHRVGAAGLGGFLLLFGLGGLSSPGFLSTNGFLATVSLVVGALLVAAAVRGGSSASTVSVTVGVAFLLSGLGNAVVLGSPRNMLAFEISNVLFSLAVGLLLLLSLGAYGRLTGRLPADGPYADVAPAGSPVPAPLSRADAMADHDLAVAERAVAARVASSDMAARVRAAAPFRTQEERRRAFLAAN